MAVFGGAALWGGPPAGADPAVPPAPARAEILVDADTGRVLYGQNEHTPMPPGSLSKILTAMIAADWLPPGAVVAGTAEAANVYPYRVGMEPGERWPLDVTMHALIIYSANDAAYALAQRISGSLPAFGGTMEYAAAQLGMRDHPVLHDPAGLDGTEGVAGGNLISAWDLAIAGRDLMANPYLASIAGTQLYYFTDPSGVLISLANFNRYFLDTYPGAIGIKTGLTDAAGFCVEEEAVRGGRHMLAVVLGGENSYQTASYLLDAGFGTPVGAETSDVSLPPVTEPYPPPRAPLVKEAALGSTLLAAAVPSSSGQPTTRDYELGVAVLVTAVAVAATAIRRVRRGLRAPVGVHSRRDEATRKVGAARRSD